MDKTFVALDARQKKFREFAEQVLPAELLKQEQLGFLELAAHIEKTQDRKTFCELAIAMLDANIVYYRPNATIRPMPTLNNTSVVVSTLLIAALVQYAFGTAAALFAAGLWYGVAANAAARRIKELTREIDDHNADVAEWAETVRGWETARDSLRSH